MGTAALVLGILGVLFSLIPLIGVIAWPMVIIGLVLGVLGILRVNARRADNRGVAISGTVLSAVGLLICVLYTVAFAAAVSDPSSTTATGGDTSVPASSGAVQNADRTSSAPAPARAGSGVPGDTLTTDDGLALTATPLTDRSKSYIGPLKCADVSYRNTGAGTATFNIWDWKLQDPNGASRNISIGGDNDLSSGELAPGGSVSGQVCFDVKGSSDGSWTLIYDGGFLQSENLSWRN